MNRTQELLNPTPDQTLLWTFCRDQQQSLVLVWFMLHSLFSQHSFQNPIGSRRVSWLPFLTSLWIVLAWMEVSCKILCLSKTSEVDDFTSRLLEIHKKMMLINKEEGNISHEAIVLIFSIKYFKLCNICTYCCRTLINQYGNLLSLDPKRVPSNAASSQFAEALAKAWAEYNVERKTLSQVEAEGQVLPDGTLMVDGRKVAVVYYRAGYTPNDYPSEAV
ncbi:hypothetical protein PR202_gb23589 [Eleusine coracana subsp. coracana]|uniref:glutathione synthase n=1 Tax=Eleusine coracana subsp. coracana TaxID=191504 RepID=A0AAV5FJU0_ELECO|nr:hypothetical protein PR202_gb23589 [Eleusine coracana subsp. coracana]